MVWYWCYFNTNCGIDPMHGVCDELGHNGGILYQHESLVCT